MRMFGEMDIIARHYNNKKQKRASWSRKYSYEKLVYQFVNAATKRTFFSRDVIWLNNTYSQHMELSQVDFFASEVEDEDM
jgi:hypothetical protein